MPKLTHPLIKSFSHAGNAYEAGEDGLIDFPDHVAGVAFAHGFKYPTAKEKEPADALEKIAALEASNAELTQRAADAEEANTQLRTLVTSSDAAKAELERELEATKAELAKAKKVKS